MTHEYLTDPFDFDGRLKILWLDDQSQTGRMFATEVGRTPATQRFNKWFAITSITDPDDLKVLRDAPQAERLASNYNRVEAPYDIYILDFRLCDAKDDCKIESHIINGIHSNAAGFFVGMQTALQWPTHPQAVIPYSAYPDEIGDQWKLLKQFPPGGVFLEKDIISKEVNFLNLLTSNVSKSYRSALRKSLETGQAFIPNGERERLAKLCSSSSYWLSAEERISVQTSYGVREFKLGSLLFDVRDRDDNKKLVVPKDVLQSEILSVLHEPNIITVRALQLAELYWSLRTSAASYSAYRAISLNKAPKLLHSVQWIGARSWKKGLGKDRQESTKIIRLAMLFLILFEYRFRLDATHLRGSQLNDTQTPMLSSVLNLAEKTRHRIEIKDPVTGRQQYSHVLDDDALCRALIDSDEYSKYKLEDALVEITKVAEHNGYLAPEELLSLTLPMKMDHLLPLFDPLPLAIRGNDQDPGAYVATLSGSNGTRVSNGLKSLLNGDAVDDPERSINLEALLGGDREHALKGLLDSEREAITELARRLYGDDEYPDWLAGLTLF